VAVDVKRQRAQQRKDNPDETDQDETVLAREVERGLATAEEQYDADAGDNDRGAEEGMQGGVVVQVSHAGT